MTDKFIAGQKVVCIDANISCNELDYLRCYTVKDVPCGRVRLQEDAKGMLWIAERFEDFGIWASHQKPASDAVELEQCKIQIVSLQATVASLQANKAEMTKREEVLLKALTIISDMRASDDNTLGNARWVAQEALKDAGL